MVAALENQNAIIVNLWDNILSPEKRKELEQLFGSKKRKETEPLSDKVEIKYRLLNNGGHNGEVSSLDTCLQRPILLTCSIKDQTVRIWDYISNKCVLTKSFVITDSSTNKITQEPLTCAALHPSGYYLAVGLQDQIKVLHLMHDDLRPFHVFDLKKTKKLKFSSGGHYLCAATDKNIFILSTYGLE